MGQRAGDLEQHAVGLVEAAYAVGGERDDVIANKLTAVQTLFLGLVVAPRTGFEPVLPP